MGVDPNIPTDKLQRGPGFSYPAGGEPIMVPRFVHMPASEGVERLLAHPIGPPQEIS